MKFKALHVQKLEFFWFLSPSNFRFQKFCFLFLRNIALLQNWNQENWTSEGILGILSDELRKTVLEWKGHLGIFSLPRAVEKFRQYELLRRDILRKRVVRWPRYRSTSKWPLIPHQTEQRDVSWHTIHTVPAAGPQNKPFPKKQLQVKNVFYIM